MLGIFNGIYIIESSSILVASLISCKLITQLINLGKTNNYFNFLIFFINQNAMIKKSLIIISPISKLIIQKCKYVNYPKFYIIMIKKEKLFGTNFKISIYKNIMHSSVIKSFMMKSFLSNIIIFFLLLLFSSFNFIRS